MTVLKEIEIDLIDDPKVDIRGEIDREGIEELATSIETTGLIQPIVVFKNRDRYEVVVGHRRQLACRVAGLKKIPAIIREVKPEEIDIMRLDENVFREDVSPVQIGKYIHSRMIEKELSTVEIARYFNKTPQWVNSMIRLLDTDEYTQEAVDKGELSYASALELQKVKAEHRRRMYTEAAVKGGAHTRLVKQWVHEELIRERDLEKEIDELVTEEKREEPKQYKMKCILCDKLAPVEQLITVQVDIRCYAELKAICEEYRKAEV